MTSRLPARPLWHCVPLPLRRAIWGFQGGEVCSLRWAEGCRTGQVSSPIRRRGERRAADRCASPPAVPASGPERCGGELGAEVHAPLAATPSSADHRQAWETALVTRLEQREARPPVPVKPEPRGWAPGQGRASPPCCCWGLRLRLTLIYESKEPSPFPAPQLRAQAEKRRGEE